MNKRPAIYFCLTLCFLLTLTTFFWGCGGGGGGIATTVTGTGDTITPAPANIGVLTGQVLMSNDDSVNVNPFINKAILITVPLKNGQISIKNSDGQIITNDIETDGVFHISGKFNFINAVLKIRGIDSRNREIIRTIPFTRDPNSTSIFKIELTSDEKGINNLTEYIMNKNSENIQKQ